jgi:hypothetical protein
MSSTARNRGLRMARDQRASEPSAGLWGLENEAEAQGAPVSDVGEQTECYTPQEEVQGDLGGHHDRHHIEAGVGGRGRSRIVRVPF